MSLTMWRVVVFFSLSMILTGCTGMQSNISVAENVFSSKRLPEIKIKIDDEYRYLGKTTKLEQGGFYRHDIYTFQNDNRHVIIMLSWINNPRSGHDYWWILTGRSIRLGGQEFKVCEGFVPVDEQGLYQLHSQNIFNPIDTKSKGGCCKCGYMSYYAQNISGSGEVKFQIIYLESLPQSIFSGAACHKVDPKKLSSEQKDYIGAYAKRCAEAFTVIE